MIPAAHEVSDGFLHRPAAGLQGVVVPYEAAAQLIRLWT
jgi:hypothetical protein